MCQYYPVEKIFTLQQPCLNPGSPAFSYRLTAFLLIRTFISGMQGEGKKERVTEREGGRKRGIWSWDGSSFSHFTSVQQSCQDPGAGSQSQTVPAADAPSDSAEPSFYLGVLKQSSDLM